jgi:hypothetical protein
VTGAKPAGTTEVSFETAPIGDPNAISQVTGEWDATSWRFTDVNSPGGAIWDDPVLGWGPGAYYRLHLTVAPTDSGAPGAVSWRLKMTWQLGGADSGSADIHGTATIGTTWWLGRTTISPWIQDCSSSSAGWVCPLQDIYDFRRDGNALALTRRDTTLLYLDGINPAWPAREVLTLQRATP